MVKTDVGEKFLDKTYLHKINISKKTIYIITSFAFVLLLDLGSSIFLYKTITDDYNTKLTVLEAKMELTEASLTKQLEQESVRNDEQRKILEDQMLSNFKQLEDSTSKITSELKLDLESQLTTVSQQVEESSSNLEGMIAALNVQSSDFSSIVDEVIKSVVSIKTNNNQQGSGVIFDSLGYILTNKHVISGAGAAVAIDYAGNIYSVQIIGVAKDADLAVLKISSNKTFNSLKFAKDEDVKVGSKVIAIGNPLGLSFTVTEGIISAKDRFIDNTGVGYIQTDVSINAGNSGGPLINSAKKIVGINTLKITETEGLGFAIPSSVAKEIAEQAVN